MSVAAHAPRVVDEVPTKAKPFVKWAGGKRQLLPELRKRVPAKFGTYFEPFVGGGALFFDLAPERAVLVDANQRLIRAYRGVRDSVEHVIATLKAYALHHSEDYYYSVRDHRPDQAVEDAYVATWFIYLNKTGFNGLYRVNRKNEFNVPFGKYKNPAICDEENLRACSLALRGAGHGYVSDQHVELFHGDFKTFEPRAVAGDFVYFDPPYAPLTATSNFTSYTAGGFSAKDQEDLRDLALRLKEGGVHVLISNSSAEVIEKLYLDKGFEIESVQARRNINSKASKRGAIEEFLIR